MKKKLTNDTLKNINCFHFLKIVSFFLVTCAFETCNEHTTNVFRNRDLSDLCKTKGLFMTRLKMTRLKKFSPKPSVPSREPAVTDRGNNGCESA